MDSILEFPIGQQLTESLQEQCVVVEEKSSSSQETVEKMPVLVKESGCINIDDVDSVNHYGVCVICFNKIMLEETALVKGCEHAYCVTCILRWASCKKDPTCPQCKNPFAFLNVHRSLDGSIYDYMFEESVCLLLRASWFTPLKNMEESVEVNEEIEYQYHYMDEEEDELDDEVYFGNSSSLRIGNRRWGDNGYVRAGRQEARPVPNIYGCGGGGGGGGGGAGSSRQSYVKKEAGEGGGGGGEGSVANVGRRAKRALKREAADKAAAAKHQQHLMRLGRK